MATYTVELYREVTEVAHVTVNASGVTEAEQAAIQIAQDLEWERVGDQGINVEDVVLED